MTTKANDAADFSQQQLETSMWFVRLYVKSAERLIKLELDAVRSAIEENQEMAMAFARAKDPQTMVALRTKLSQMSTERLMKYARQIYEIATETRTQLVALMDDSLGQVGDDIQGAMSKGLRCLPGAEAALQPIRAMLAATNAAVDNMMKAASLASTMADTNPLTAAAKAAAPRAKTPSRKRA